MNKKWIKQDITEAKEQIDDILKKFNKNNNYTVVDFELDMQHVYSHLNVAYNTRHWTVKEINNFTDNDYNKVRKIPNDLTFIDY